MFQNISVILSPFPFSLRHLFVPLHLPGHCDFAYGTGIVPTFTWALWLRLSGNCSYFYCTLALLLRLPGTWIVQCSCVYLDDVALSLWFWRSSYLYLGTVTLSLWNRGCSYFYFGAVTLSLLYWGCSYFYLGAVTLSLWYWGCLLNFLSAVTLTLALGLLLFPPGHWDSITPHKKCSYFYLGHVTSVSGTKVFPTFTWTLWLYHSDTGVVPTFTCALWLYHSGTGVFPTVTWELWHSRSGTGHASL